VQLRPSLLRKLGRRTFDGSYGDIDSDKTLGLTPFEPINDLRTNTSSTLGVTNWLEEQNTEQAHRVLVAHFQKLTTAMDNIRKQVHEQLHRG